MSHSSLKQRLLGAGLALSLAGGPAIAAPVCQVLDAKERDLRLDTYFPMSGVTSYRAIMGLTTALTDSEGGKADYEARETEAEKLQAFVHRMFPDWDVTPYYYGNCRLEAPFIIYQERVKRFGADHPYVLQWLKAQRAVLSQCRDAGPGTRSDLPVAEKFADPALKTLQEQDRRYQQAAVLFYSQDFPGAAMAYDAIAQDRASPLRAFATYMAAASRAKLIPGSEWPEAEQTQAEQQEKKTAITALLRELQTILADQSLAEVHGWTVSLLGWFGNTSNDPAAERAQLEEALRALQVPDTHLATDPAARQRYNHAYEDIRSISVAAAKNDPLAQWLRFPGPRASYFEMGNWATDPRKVPEGYYELIHSSEEQTPLWEHIGYYYKGDRDSLAAAVTAETARVQGCGDEQALALLSQDYYELVRLTWQAATRSSEQADFESAEALLRDYAFKNSQAWQLAVRDSLHYLAAGGYLARARRLRDLLELPTKDTLLNLEIRGILAVLAEDAPHLARAASGFRTLEATAFFNGLSIDALWQLSATGGLEKEKRALLARTAWTRSYVLGRNISPQHDQLMRELNVEFVKGWRSRPGDVNQPGNIRVLRDLMASPGFNVEIQEFSRLSASDVTGGQRPSLTGVDYYHHNDSNWWCAFWLDRHAASKEATLQYMFGHALDKVVTRRDGISLRTALAPAMRESFLFQAQGPAELDALSRAQCAPKLLGARVLKWVRDTPPGLTVEGQDEALANLVWSTRYGCARQGGHGETSRAAYELLHARFPHSAAAQRTKYWFDCPPYGNGCKTPDPLNTPSRR
jgi:hypothetical protein